MKLYLYPFFAGEDKGEGGVRRVVDAQRRWLPEFGVEIIDAPRLADVIAIHIAADATLLERYPDVPVVAHNHGFYWAEYEWQDWCHRANEQCMELLRQADAITAPSEWVAQSIRRNTLRQVQVLGHGIDPDEWPEVLDSQGFVLWNKTRIDPVCDSAPVAELAMRAPDVPFVSTFGPQLKNLQLTGRIPYPQAKQVVQQAGVYLCTARETFGIGTLEAMAAGVPVLGWRWGGQAELIEHKVHGWLAAPNNYDDLLEGLHYCLEHRERLGKAARELALGEYTWRQALEPSVRLYQDVMAQRAAERPKVSVVVRAHNLARYLPECLDSVLRQSLQDFECIVVDDASTDDSGAIADEYAQRDSRVKVQHLTENAGIVGALNKGIGSACGQYIMQHDADNVLPERALELLVGPLDNDRSLHIAYGNVQFVNEQGEPEDFGTRGKGHSGWPPQFRGEWQVQRGNRERPPNLIPSNALHRRDVWHLLGGYRERYQNAEDADFWTRATSYGFRARMVTEADTLIYRIRRDSVSSTRPVADWSNWYPWARENTLPPAGIVYEEQQPVPSYEPVLISVIIPVGPGHEELYIDALDSVDAQTFRLWEVILVNDTGKPLRYVPSWAQLVQRPSEVDTLGVARARNAGIKASMAKLFVPLDADDTLEPRGLAELFQAYQEHGGYVYCDWYEKFADRQNVWETLDWPTEQPVLVPETGKAQGALHAVTALYPRSAWEQVGGFDESMDTYEDWDFQLKLAEAGICGTRVPLPLFTYRKETGFRREQAYANLNSSWQGILDRWGEYFDGRKQLVGCRSCPGGGGGRIQQAQQAPAVQQIVSPPPDQLSEYVVVEYTGSAQGSLVFRAPSGIEYHFAALPSEYRKYVRRGEDAEFFASKGSFIVREIEAPTPA